MIRDNHSLMVLDITVMLDDGSIADIEMQRFGYMFPGQRAACYSSDLMLRQYSRVKEHQGKSFVYRDIKPVYSIIFMENSPQEFEAYPEEYIHHFTQRSNTGLELPLLQNYYFIPLDIFRKRIHNEVVQNISRLDGWLLFLSSDDPSDICWLIEVYPYFRPLYERMFTILQDIGRMMDMYSEELKILDDNTVDFMIDNLRQQVEEQKSELADKNAELADKDAELAKQKAAMDDMEAQIKRLEMLLASEKQSKK